MLRAWLIVGALAWPAMLGSAHASRIDGHAAVGAIAVYASASHVCHQQPSRSFHISGVQAPVCARCTGLYLGGAIGALFALLTGRRRVPRVGALVVAGAPTAIAWLVEFAGGVEVGNVTRAVTALPLGACLVVVLATVAARGSEAIG